MKLCTLKLRMGSSSIMVPVFLNVFFNKKSAVQTARLHDSLAVHRLETAVQCTLQDTYLEPSFEPLSTNPTK